MPCCDCCCPEDEECCKGPGANGICCKPDRCCGTEESPECCEEGEYCCDDACQETPCDEEECETDEDCLYCDQSYDLIDTNESCAPGFTRSGDTCLRLVKVADCDECDPTPPGNSTDWGSSCVQGYCCDGECSDEECPGCETDEDCDYCNEGYSLVGGAYNISDELRCCGDGAIGWIDDAGDARFPNCVSDIDPGNVDNNFNIVAGDATQSGYCCDGVCSEEPCPEPLAVKLTLGPGSILKAMLAKMGILATARCKCAKMARQMDAWGQESLNHLDEIADVMEETAKKRGLPFSRTAAKLMIRIACWRARRGNKG
jgi:hypothetical protein